MAIYVNKRLLKFCCAGFLLCSFIYGVSREYPLHEYTYIQKSDHVDYYVSKTTRGGTKEYGLIISDENMIYKHPAFDRDKTGLITRDNPNDKDKTGFIIPDDLTDKDYFFDTKVMINTNDCKKTEEGHKSCYAPTFYDGYFYSHKYDKVFRVSGDKEWRILFVKYSGYFFIWVIFYGIYAIFTEKPLFYKKERD
ncbi:hypothetical protein [Moraxella nonliquefaciens]|jgi:hypothetical protein|uniref:hypothetical protein n=1 Tax=Moraxella nonliquefaciens TaxID=478 RepID=UPI00081ED8C2|nr:hypothetical protein [Moraxella nonliquefaciens]OBX49613.1 hypothetical protein A9Z65_09455 [Moraxella nonliquefaciens]